MEKLFSYGTLQQSEVQIANFGRILTGQQACLPCYVIGEIVIKDKQVIETSGKSIHPILRFTGDQNDQVSGTVYLISKAELLKADAYEVDDYQRIKARLKSGDECWIYAAAKSFA